MQRRQATIRPPGDRYIHPLKEDEERLAPECSNYEKFLIDTATHTAQGLTASKILLINPLTLRPSG